MSLELFDKLNTENVKFKFDTCELNVFLTVSHSLCYIPIPYITFPFHMLHSHSLYYIPIPYVTIPFPMLHSGSCRWWCGG